MAGFVERLGALDACAVSDAKDSLGLPAAISGLDRQSGRGLLVGRVKLVEGVPPVDMRGVVLDGPTPTPTATRRPIWTFQSLPVAPRRAPRVAAFMNAPPEDIEIGGQRVSDGDFVIADASGVVFIRAADIERVVEAAERIARKEATMVAALARRQSDHGCHGCGL